MKRCDLLTARSHTTGEHQSDHWHRRLLRARRERPNGRRAAEQCDERAALDLRAHSITSSAATCSVGGTVRPSTLAVLRFITNSNLVGCKTAAPPIKLMNSRRLRAGMG